MGPAAKVLEAADWEASEGVTGRFGIAEVLRRLVGEARGQRGDPLNAWSVSGWSEVPRGKSPRGAQLSTRTVNSSLSTWVSRMVGVLGAGWHFADKPYDVQNVSAGPPRLRQMRLWESDQFRFGVSRGARVCHSTTGHRPTTACRLKDAFPGVQDSVVMGERR